MLYSGSVAGYRAMTTRGDFWRTALPIFVVAMAVTTIFPNLITGLHGDEAWVILRAHEIGSGSHAFEGMNFYTSALNQYLAWPFLAASGFQFSALRVAAGLCNSIGLLFALAILRALHPHETATWRWTGALWVTSASFIAFSRFAVDVNMLTPFLVLMALWLAIVATRLGAGTAFYAGSLGSGLAFGMAVYNHLLAAALVAGLAIGAFAGFGRAMLRARCTWLIAAAFFCAITPRVVLVVTAMSHGAGPTFGTVFDAIKDLQFLPSVLIGMLDGGVIFQRFTGERLVPVIPYFSFALVGLGCANWWYASGLRLAPVDRAMLVGWIAMPVLILLITPGLSLRYFQFPALITSYAIVRFAQSCHSAIGRSVLAAVLVLQVGYVAVDYFWAFARSGGRLSNFSLGSRLMETSNHFVRTDNLYRQLVAAGVTDVYAEPLLIWPLASYDIVFHHFAVFILDPRNVAAVSPTSAARRPAIIAYNAPSLIGSQSTADLTILHQLDIGPFRFKRRLEFEQKFIVLIGEQDFESTSKTRR